MKMMNLIVVFNVIEVGVSLCLLRVNDKSLLFGSKVSFVRLGDNL